MSKEVPATTQKKKSKRKKSHAPSLSDVGSVSKKYLSRATALCLYLDVLKGKSLQHSLEPAFERLNPIDRGFTLELLMGSLRYHVPLKLRVQQCLKAPLKSQQQWLEAVLMLGCYQLYCMNVPARAVIHTMVELVRSFGFDHLTGLVNGVLRTLDRRRSGTEENPIIQTLAIHDYLNQKHWLYTDLYRDWKPYFLDIMARFQQKPKMSLRVNQLKGTADEFCKRLTAEGIETFDKNLSDFELPNSITLTETQNVMMLPGYELGLFSVQDVSAQAAVQILVDAIDSPSEEPLRVLDACAAPGGKTAALLEGLPSKTLLDAVEIDGTRLVRIEENLKRLDLSTEGVRIIHGDFSEELAALDQTDLYDIILLDVPCSGTGVISRHPDILFCRQKEDIAGLVQIQRTLLERAEALLKPNGLLLYATCSILKEENSDNIQWYMDSCPTQLVELPLSESLGIQQTFGKQRLPLPDASGDGFYYALFRKHG